MSQFTNLIDLMATKHYEGTPTVRIAQVLDANDTTWEVRAEAIGDQDTLQVRCVRTLREESVDAASLKGIVWPVIVAVRGEVKESSKSTSQRLREEARARETDDLAAVIRRVDGAHTLGAGALAEAIVADGFLDRVVSNR